MKPTDYEQLFVNYIELEEQEKAAEVIKAVDRALVRLDLKLVEAPDYQEELDIESQIGEFQKLKTEFKTAIETDTAKGTGGEC